VVANLELDSWSRELISVACRDEVDLLNSRLDPFAFVIALANAQVDLEAGFTTVLDMDSRGGFNTVEIRDASEIEMGTVYGPPPTRVTGGGVIVICADPIPAVVTGGVQPSRNSAAGSATSEPARRW